MDIEQIATPFKIERLPHTQEVRQRHLRVFGRGQHGVRAEDLLPGQTASHPPLTMRKGPGHSGEGHLGSPDTDLTLNDRRASTIMQVMTTGSFPLASWHTPWPQR